MCLLRSRRYADRGLHTDPQVLLPHEGNNPYPLVKDKGARCCDECNDIVIFERIRQIKANESKKGDDSNESITRE